jgi:hypothetical protein
MQGNRILPNLTIFDRLPIFAFNDTSPAAGPAPLDEHGFGYVELSGDASKRPTLPTRESALE